MKQNGNEILQAGLRERSLLGILSKFKNVLIPAINYFYIQLLLYAYYLSQISEFHLPWQMCPTGIKSYIDAKSFFSTTQDQVWNGAIWLNKNLMQSKQGNKDTVT